MVFSSSIFLFAFLPLVLLLVFIGPRKGEKGVLWRNFWLTCASFVFYAWGEPQWVVALFVLAWINHMLGRCMERYRTHARLWLVVGVALDISLLLLVKYGAWLANTALDMARIAGLTHIDTVFVPMALPLGISFFTFQAISYLVDIYRGDVPAARSYIDFSCYLTMFSQLVAGPIVRYADIASDIRARKDSLGLFHAGIQRFVLGLGKKILVANQVALLADWAFQTGPAELTTAIAWIGILAYAAQIYYDFSGYSDMAIGLGYMFGFHFQENFRHPYGALSMQDFWRRWHISLSSWFRDYVYIPLGGNRVGPLRTYLNLIVVFFLCGLWHGAAFNFVLWGLWHGAFLVLERAGLQKKLDGCPHAVRRLYVWLAFLAGWVLFRAETMAYAGSFYAALLGFGQAGAGSLVDFVLYRGPFAFLLVLALVGSCGFPARVFLELRQTAEARGGVRALCMETGTLLLGLGMVSLCTAFVLAGSYNPFIYFRF